MPLVRILRNNPALQHLTDEQLQQANARRTRLYRDDAQVIRGLLEIIDYTHKRKELKTGTDLLEEIGEVADGWVGTFEEGEFEAEVEITKEEYAFLKNVLIDKTSEYIKAKQQSPMGGTEEVPIIQGALVTRTIRAFEDWVETKPDKDFPEEEKGEAKKPEQVPA